MSPSGTLISRRPLGAFPARRAFVLAAACAAFVTGALPTAASAGPASNYVIPDPVQVSYSVDNGQVTVTGCNGDCPSELVIPDTIDGNPVVAIASGAFQHQTSITSITIPEGVTTIGAVAFDGVNGVSSITIPSSVTSMGRATFQGMSALTSATFAAGSQLTTIPESAFRMEPNLSSITIPASITTIEEAAFWEDASLATVSFEGAAPSIGSGAFGQIAHGAVAQIAHWSLSGYGSTGDDFYGLTVSQPAAPPYYYAITNGNATITGCRALCPSSLTIPAEIDGAPVTKIGSWAFYY